jgi:protein-disulfide isomerase
MRHYLSATLAAATLLTATPGQAQTAPAGKDDAPAMDDADRAALHAEIRAYLLANPEILVEMYALLEEKQQAATAQNDSALVEEHAAAIFDDGFSFVGGNPDGDVTLVEFLDYQCGFCRRAHPELAELIETDGNIRWVVKEFPILGPNSELAARAASATLIAEGGEAYARLNDAMMRHDGPVTDAVLDGLLTEAGADPAEIRATMDAPDITERLTETRALAETLGISGTPTFVLGSRMIRGYVSAEQMLAMIEEERPIN